MAKRGDWLLLIAFVVTLALWWLTRRDPAHVAQPSEPRGPRYEARSWLQNNRNPYPLASNRFPTRDAAAAFIDSLYTLGADTVYVTGVEEDSSWIVREGGPYADALWIRLPDDPQQRARLFAIGAREARREGFDPDVDLGQRYVLYWWD